MDPTALLRDVAEANVESITLEIRYEELAGY